jgi:hypothetical protein
MGNLMDRKKLLEKEKMEVVKVEFEDGDFVYVRQMTGHERDTFEQSLLKKVRDNKGTIVSYEQSTEDFRAKLAVVTICDEKGNTILQPNDYAMLSRSMSAKRLEKIVDQAQKLNAITEEDKELIVKNSDAVQDGSSNLGFAENLE